MKQADEEADGQNAEMLPQNLIARLPVHDLSEWGFKGLLSWTAVHAVIVMGKTRGWCNKRNWT
jgi:hypothetical protein